jgi:hypothetical protein
MITMHMKRLFFDSAAVKKSVKPAKRASLSKAGAWIRRAARSLLRKRKRPAAPGSPPSVHSTDSVATLKNILFAYDRARDSVVVGPVQLNQKDYLNGFFIKGTVPQLHEFGGVAGVVEEKLGDKWYRLDRRYRDRGNRQTRRRESRYPARPFMAPALRATQSQLPRAWQNSVVRAA